MMDKERMAELTERYHLVNNDGVIEMDINGWKIKTIDFSDIKNIGLLDGYDNTKFKLSIVLEAIRKLLSLKDVENSPFPEDIIDGMLDEGLDRILGIAENIFENMLNEDWSNDIKNNKYKEFFADFKHPWQLIKTLLDIILCIDIAVYSGLKYIDENKHSIVTKLVESGRAKVFLIGGDGKVIEDEEAMKKLLEENLDKMIIREEKDEPNLDFDLASMKTIGNA